MKWMLWERRCGMAEFGMTRVRKLRRRLVRGCFQPPHFDFHIDARSQPIDDRHKPIHGEPPEICVADARKVRRGNPRAVVRGAHGQVFPVERLDDFGG
jgi:hypothetical protein